MANSDTAPECHERILHMLKSSRRSRPTATRSRYAPRSFGMLGHRIPTTGASSRHRRLPELLEVCRAGGIVLDPYMGSGTVAVVGSHLGFAVRSFDFGLLDRCCRVPA